MEPQYTRIAIYPKDVKIITGNSLRWSQQILQELRKSLNRSKKQIVTFKEFYEYMGLRREVL